jgi:hypothetical protein
MRSVEMGLGLQTALTYYLIASSKHPIMGRLICWFGSGDLPRFDVEQSILMESWLTGIWFSPSALSDSAKTLNAINDRRAAQRPALPMLRFGFSVYSSSLEDVLGAIAKDGHGLKNVEAVIYDVCDDPGTCQHYPPESEGCAAD